MSVGEWVAAAAEEGGRGRRAEGEVMSEMAVLHNFSERPIQTPGLTVQLIPVVLDGVEVRTPCRPVEFFRTKLGELALWTGTS